MIDRDALSRELEAFQVLLDGHGAERTRWPAPQRLRFAGLLAESSEARRRLAEAEALDSLLARAPLPSPSRHAALVDRIVDAARAQGAPSAAAVTVLHRPARRRPLVSGLPVLGLPVSAFRARGPAAALLAASLLVGIFVGVTGAANPALQRFETLAGLAAAVDAPPASTATWDDPSLASEEDTL